MPIYLLPSPCIYTGTNTQTLLNAVPLDRTGLKSAAASAPQVQDLSCTSSLRVDSVCFLTFVTFKHTHRVVVRELEQA